MHNDSGKERIWDTNAGKMRGKCVRYFSGDRLLAAIDSRVFQLNLLLFV